MDNKKEIQEQLAASSKEEFRDTNDSLKLFKKNNPTISIQHNNNIVEIDNCWGESSLRILIKEDDDMSFMSNIQLYNELWAIYHIDQNIFEFIYYPLKQPVERSFDLQYVGKKFSLYYDKPSSVFNKLVKLIKIIPGSDFSERTYSVHRYQRRSDDKLYPINFFVKGDFGSMSHEDHIELFKHINFYLSYYDRKTPTILIYDVSSCDQDNTSIPCLTSGQSDLFPDSINCSKKIWNAPLDLLETARNTSNIRLKYIFYYQVLEYYSYYYLENSMRRNLKNIINSPDILEFDKYSQKIIEEFRNYSKKYKEDITKIENFVEEFCTIDDIRVELENNIDCFIKDIPFDGGFVSEKLAKTEEDLFKQSELLKMIVRRIDKIRNVLVHARETRENTVISPTSKNSKQLLPYLFLLRRIAEVIAIKYE